MNIQGDGNADEYIVTALQIFEYCGADKSSTLRVDALMDKFAPFIKTNRSEYTFLKSLLDPDQSNPEITVSKLAETLNKYSENQKVKVDLEESFNLKSGQGPHDSDSGISTDGFQLLEELQCELREKSHLAHQLRSQLDFTDRQHEEALAALTAERDSLKSHLNMLREENMTLSHVRRDYEDMCDQLCQSERTLDEARRDLDAARRKLRHTTDQLADLDTEKASLSEQLAKSKKECHRIHEIYASQQSTLSEQNERYRSELTELAARLDDQEEFARQLLREKVSLEMELKEMLNKTNQTHSRLDRSIDVSYTEDQMLTALDSLNADSRFSSENRILDEDSFVKTLKEDQGRATNMSLFDEIRLSFSNISKHNVTEMSHNVSNDRNLDTSFINVATQTDIDDTETNKISVDIETQTDVTKEMVTKSTQTIGIFRRRIPKLKPKITAETKIQTDTDKLNNNCEVCVKCMQCEKFNDYTTKLESDYRRSQNIVNNMRLEIDAYESNLDSLKKLVDEGKERNGYMKSVVEGLKNKLVCLEEKCVCQSERINMLSRDMLAVEVQTECGNGLYELITMST